MGWHDFDDGFILVKQGKTGTELAVPVHPNLADELANVGGDRPTFLTTSRGKPFSSSASFGNWFRDQTRAAGLTDCPAHGLRKAAARRLGEAGCTDRQIMSITGHTSHSEVSRYTKAMDQRRLAAEAMAKLTNQNPNC